MNAPNIVVLEDTSDERGFCYSLPRTNIEFLRLVKGGAVLSIKPGVVRGNHFHEMKLEMNMIIFSDTWTFFYQREFDKEPASRKFEGKGMALIMVPPLCSHAIRNDGKADITMIYVSNIDCDPEHSDAVSSVIIG